MVKIEIIIHDEKLSSKLYLKQCLYNYHMAKGTSTEVHLTIFTKIISNLSTMEIEYDKKLILPYVRVFVHFAIIFDIVNFLLLCP